MMDFYELIIPILVSLLGVLVVRQIYNWINSADAYPPGPWGLPLLGHLLQLGMAPHKTLIRWKKDYGPILACRFGSFPAIAISDYRILRKILGDPAFSGRPDIETFKHRSGGERHGILFGDGEEWMEQRRFTIKNLRDFGLGKSSLENTLQNEISEVLDLLGQDAGNPIRIRPRIAVAVINSLWGVITGERFRHDDRKLHAMFAVIQGNLEKFNGLSAVAMFMPWLTKAFPKFSGFHDMTKDLGALLEFLNEPISKHRETVVYGHSRDLIDAYLNQMHTCTDPASSFHRDNYAEITLRTVCLDLFTAGAETTTTTFAWMCLYLAVNPEVQVKVHEEIDRVVGRSRLVSLADKPNLPYLEAVTQETLRFSSIVPLGLFKRTISNVVLESYLIPKDTMVITNLYDAHHDEGYWGDPQVFRPERWLSMNAEAKKLVVVKHEAFFPFLGGKRSCLGEDLARAELFIFGSNLLQRFNIETDPENPTPSLEPIVSTVLMPQGHKLAFKERGDACDSA